MTTVRAVYGTSHSTGPKPSTQDPAKPNIAFLELHVSLKNISSLQLVECTSAMPVDTEGELEMEL